MRASRLNFHRRSGALAAGLVPGSLAGLPDITHTQIRVAERTSGEVGLTLDIYGFLFGQFVVESNQTGRDPFLNIQPLPGSPGGSGRFAGRLHRRSGDAPRHDARARVDGTGCGRCTSAGGSAGFAQIPACRVRHEAHDRFPVEIERLLGGVVREEHEFATQRQD